MQFLQILADETVFQQQVRELWSIEGSLSTIIVVLIILLIVVILAALSMELKLGRANRIARATHDLVKAALDEQKKANAMLQYLNDRAYDAAAKPKENAERPTPNAESRMEKTEEPRVYRID